MNQIELFPAMSISATGLKAERTRMEVAANNLANANTTRGPGGEVYQRKQVVFSTIMSESLNQVTTNLGGVEVEGIVEDERPPVETYAPFHPDADASGMIETPRIAPLEEMMDMITATRAYQANLSAMRQTSDMARRTIELSRQG
jgi:flagellar basal-body rod protein FlgC